MANEELNSSMCLGARVPDGRGGKALPSDACSARGKNRVHRCHKLGPRASCGIKCLRNLHVKGNSAWN